MQRFIFFLFIDVKKCPFLILPYFVNKKEKIIFTFNQYNKVFKFNELQHKRNSNL